MTSFILVQSFDKFTIVQTEDHCNNTVYATFTHGSRFDNHVL